MVPACSVKVPRVSTYSGYRHASSSFAYGTFTLSGQLSQNCSAKLAGSILRSEPHGARTMVWALPFSLAATHRITCCFLFLRLLRCFSSPGSLLTLWIGVRTTEVCSARFPHSDISGSMDICSSPKLFAAYHVLHRLLVPRHPPYALISITKRVRSTGMDLPPHMYSVTCVGNRPIYFKSVFFRLYC